MALGPLWLSHAPEPRDDHLNLCGHLHPVAVVGQGADRLRLPCFALLRGESAPAHALASRDAEALPNQPGSAHAVHCPGDCLVLPAFGHLTGGHPCSEADGVWLVAEGSVVPWRVPARSLPEPSLGNRTTSPTPTTASPRIRRSRA